MIVPCYTFGMSIVLTIREQLKDAMRAKEQVVLDTLRGVMSACTSELLATGKTPQDEITDDIVLKVVGRLVKQRKDAIAQYETGGRSDLADKERMELTVLEKFKPPQMSDADIKMIAELKKKELNITDKSKSGILVGAVMKEAAKVAAKAGEADGAAVKLIVESLFA